MLYEVITGSGDRPLHMRIVELGVLRVLGVGGGRESDARSLIENANGGSGNDSFVGNAADNVRNNFV